MDNEKIGLFQTILETYNKGNVSLSPSDKAKIENETFDLIRKSQMNRKASAMPEIETEMAEKFEGTSDPKKVLTVVLDALKEEGVIESDGSDDSDLDGKIKNVETKLDKLLKEEDKEEDKEDKDSSEGASPPFGDDDDDDDKSEKDMEFKRAQALDMAKNLDKECPFTPGKGTSKGKEKKRDIKDLQNDKDNEVIEDLDNMGIEEESKFMSYARKIRAGINSAKDVVLFHEDKPVAYVRVPKEIKANAADLKRYAHKVCATLIYDGTDGVKSKFAAKIIGSGIGGSDDNIVTTGGDVPAANDAVTDNVDVVSKEDPDKMPNTALEGVDFDSKEKQDKVVAAADKVARYKVLDKKAKDTILDNAEFVSTEKPDSMDAQSTSVSDGADDVAKEDPKKPEDSVLENVDDDIKSVEARFQQVYKVRAEKEANKRVASFIDKFVTCFKLASQRMTLNHDYHPLKAAAFNVLVADNVKFADGFKYQPMDKRTATELIELFFSEGQNEFVDTIMDRTASLMKKSDEYIKDASDDLGSLSPVDVTPDDLDISDKMDEKSSSLRREVKKGNFEFNGTNATSPVKKTSSRDQLRSAIAGSTRLGRTFDIG